MSLFYRSLTWAENQEFQQRKRIFKRDRPCVICGRILPSEEMAIAHIVPVSELSDRKAIFDEGNWEVRCIYCERKLHHEEQLRKNKEVKLEQEENPQAEYLRQRRRQTIARRRQYRDIQRAGQEIQVKRLSASMSHGRKRKRHRKHRRDDYYAKRKNGMLD